MHTNSEKRHRLPYFFCRKITTVFFRCLCRVHLVVLEPPIQRGPCILASNHISHFDPVIISNLFPRALDWIAMEELFRSRYSARFFTSVNAIPVDRFGTHIQTNRRSLRTILTRLSQQHAVGIFPEGGIRAGSSSILEGASMKPALATISLLSQAPIVPCVILGSDRLYQPTQWLRRPHLWVIIGKALLPPPKKSSEQEKIAFQNCLTLSFPKLQEELCKCFHLNADDLPKTPQARKGDER